MLRACGIAPGNAEAWDALGLALMLTGEANRRDAPSREAQRLAPQTLDYRAAPGRRRVAAGAERELNWRGWNGSASRIR